MHREPLLSIAIVLVGALALLVTARAGTITALVTVTTSPLITDSADAPFALAFSLTDGGQPGNNSVTLSSFNFGTGGAVGAAIPGDCVSTFFTCGDESGDASGTATLGDSDFYNGLVQGFTPGSNLTFELSFTAASDTCVGCSPDGLVFQILTDCGSASDPCTALATTDATFSSLLDVNLATGDIAAFSSTSPIGVSATYTLPTPTTVPEPGSFWLLTGGLFGLLLVIDLERRRFRLR